ncbi:MAG TPA: endonuclease/exonuclease/phosphatase family protein [Bacteroidales bacterium]
MQAKSGIKLLKAMLLLLNIVAIVALEFALLASHTMPSSTAFLAVFGLFYPIILFINLFFILLWILLRSYWAVLSLIFILIGFQNLKNNFPFNFSENDVSTENSIKVLSYNVQNFGFEISDSAAAKMKQDIISYVVEKEPDIICFQEFKSRDKLLYEPLKSLKNELNAESYYFESYFNPRYNEYLTGLAIFSKYDAVNKGKLKFEGSRTFGIYTDLVINMDTVRVYNIHFASIQLMQADIGFVVNPDIQNEKDVKLHFLKIYDKLSAAFRLREKQVAFLVNQIKVCPYEIILCGDFNDPPSSYTYHEATDFLQDTFVEKGKGMSWSYAGQIPFLRIDYIMKSSGFKTIDYQLDKVSFSDHFPVMAILEIN